MTDDVLTASGSVTRTERALQLYDLALAVLGAKGSQSSSGSIAVTVYSKELLTIRYWQNKGNLEVWHGPRVLMVEQWGGTPHITSFTSGEWERELEAEANDTN
jgi:hypothetical protein